MDIERTATANSGILLFVVNDPAFFLSHRLNIARAAARAGFEVHVATPADAAAAAITAENFVHHPIPLNRYSSNPLRELRTIWALALLYRRLRPKLIHHVTIKPVLYGSIAARGVPQAAVVNAISGLGQVFTARGLKGGLRRAVVCLLYRVAFRRARLKAIFQNRDDFSALAERGIIRTEQGVMIAGAGVDIERFAPHAPPAAPLTIMFASRLLREKGVREFVEAAAMLRRRGNTARFVVVGGTAPGNPGSITEAELDEWKARGDVEFWGVRASMPEVLAQAHVFCLPSYYGEGIPKALIEAAACAMALVTADTPGCRELVRDGENGVIVPPRDTAALAAALERLCGDAQLRARLGAKARDTVAHGGFSDERVVADTLAVYRSLTS